MFLYMITTCTPFFELKHNEYQGGSSLMTQINSHQAHVFILGIQHQN
jgi:hypothetical protein